MSDIYDYKKNLKNDSSNRSNSCHHLSTTKTTIVSNFPVKLHFMLNELQKDGLEYIASWQDHGRSFIVRDPKELESKILPCYFQQSKFSSFQRQLNFYGFQRVVSGRDKGGYFHEHFLRGNEEVAIKVQRTKIKGTGPRRPNSIESHECNFYEMAFLSDNNKMNSNHTKEKKKEHSHTVKNTHEYTPHKSAMKAFEAKIPEEIPSSSPERKEGGDKLVTWTRNQELLHQIQRLNEIDRDLILLSRASYKLHNYEQALVACQANSYGMGSLPSSVVSCITPIGKTSIYPSQSSFLGLNHYPLAISSRLVPRSLYNRTSTTLPFFIGDVTPPTSSTASDFMISQLLS